MKNIEKALTNFVSGKGQRVSDEALCDCAKKDPKAADEIIDILFNVINRELDSITTMFSLKAQHGFVEAQAPMVIEHKKTTDIDTINAQLEALKGNKIIDADYEESE